MKQITCLFFACMLGCSVSPPDILDVSLPSDTDDEMGPYLISAHTWGAIDTADVDWRIQPSGSEATTQLRMVEVRPHHWECFAKGVPAGSEISMRIVVEGPGGKAQFPPTGMHRFRVIHANEPCAAPCLHNEQCVNGECISGGCRTNDQCPPSQICQAGRCESVSECNTHLDCPTDLSCQNGRCVLAENCGEGCPEGLICNPGSSQCVACFEDSHCPSARCNLEINQCVQCLENSDCMRLDQCVEGVCQTPSCSADDNEPNDVFEQATPVEFDEVTEGKVCEQDMDIFITQSDSIGVEIEFLDGAPAEEGLTIITYLADGQQFNRTEYAGGVFLANSRVFGITATNGPQQYRLRVSNRGMICADNRFEPDDAPPLATRIGASGARVNALVCTGNEDWFRIRQRRTDGPGVLLIKTTAGTLDLHLVSHSGQSVERVVVGPNIGRPWLAIPYGDRDEDLYSQITCGDCVPAGNPYWIATRPMDVEPCSPDPLEPNDTVEDATFLAPGEDIDLPELNVCGGHDDWYRVLKESNRTIEFHAEFLSQRGDIDILVYSESMELVTWAITGTNGHRMVLDNELPPGIYFIQVALFGSGENQYRLNLTHN